MCSKLEFNPKLTLYWVSLSVAIPFVVFAAYSPREMLPAFGIGVIFIAVLFVAGFPIKYSRKGNELIKYWGNFAIGKYDLSSGYIRKKGIGIFVNGRQLYWILPGSKDEVKMMELLK